MTMDLSVLEKSTLFSGLSAKAMRDVLEKVPHHIQCYDKDETIFHLMEDSSRLGIILEGRVEAQKPFPNGSQINVSVRNAGEMIGPAALFSRRQKYPCDVVAVEPATIMMFRKEDILLLLQKDSQILKNFMAELATAAYMLQQRLELLSYSGIAQKAAFYLLMQQRQTGSSVIPIPDSVSKWAMSMNVSRPSLHRELKKLEGQSFIHCNAHTIEILDAAGLQSVLSE
jgi:CRP-like cAMP-binding protein